MPDAASRAVTVIPSRQTARALSRTGAFALPLRPLARAALRPFPLRRVRFGAEGSVKILGGGVSGVASGVTGTGVC